MGNVTRTITVVAALLWLSAASSLAAPPTCGNKNCRPNAALSGLSGGALAACTKTVSAACNAMTCTCSTNGVGGTCDGATLCATTTTTGAATTTTSSGAATTTTSSGAATTTTSSTAPTTTTTSSTTTTTLGPLSLKYTTAPGTSSCGGTGLSTPPTAPFSGEIDSDTACATKLSDLGSSCLYIGGGANGAVPGGPTPAGASSYLDLGSGNALVASNGTGKLDCTKGSGPASECVNAGTCVGGPSPGATCFSRQDCNTACTGAGTPAACCTFAGGGECPCTGRNPHKSCTSDTDCGGAFPPAGACQPVENCFFGPPLAIPDPAIPVMSTCVINVIATDASGTGDPTTGAASVDIPLVSRVYLTGNLASPCPQCNCGTPPCSGTGATGCNAGPSAGGACSTTATTGNPATGNTSQDCPPEEGMGFFAGALSVDLNPLTTGSVSVTSATGSFCPSQTNPGAFGQGGTRCITETGMPAGDLTDGMPHAAREATVFCIPATNNGTFNLLADLPGPGATSLPGIAQIVPTP